MKKTTKKRLKKIFNLYNFAVLTCIILIIVALIILINPDFKIKLPVVERKIVVQEENSNEETNNKEEKSKDIKIVESEKSGKEVTEKDARKTAKKQFKELGEKDIKEDDLEVLQIQREGKKFYYVSSQKNTIEISIDDGEITRINSVKVNK